MMQVANYNETAVVVVDWTVGGGYTVDSTDIIWGDWVGGENDLLHPSLPCTCVYLYVCCLFECFWYK